MAMCLNRITMNIIKDKCIGNRNLEAIGLCDSYEDYCRMITEEHRLSKEDYTFVKTWSNKKPRARGGKVE